MKNLLIIIAAVMAISCRSPLMVWDDVTQSYVTEAEKKAREEEEKAAQEKEEETATVTITIIIQ